MLRYPQITFSLRWPPPTRNGLLRMSDMFVSHGWVTMHMGYRRKSVKVTIASYYSTCLAEIYEYHIGRIAKSIKLSSTNVSTSVWFWPCSHA
jgi:hypothetical protein